MILLAVSMMQIVKILHHTHVDSGTNKIMIEYNSSAIMIQFVEPVLSSHLNTGLVEDSHTSGYGNSSNKTNKTQKL